ncbi:unnamed protein product, partial [marine sediment metagenome]
QEILDALEELEVATAQELSEFIDVGAISIRNSLNRLLREMEVEKIELTRTEVLQEGIKFSGKHFKWKIKQTRPLKKD